MRQIWTEEEIEILRREYPTTSSLVLAVRLGRNFHKIQNKACQLGIAKDNAWRQAQIVNIGDKGGGKQRPVGTIIVQSNGYASIKIGAPNQWEPYHKYLWKKEHGDIPDGYIAAFKDEDRTNFDIENIVIMTQAEIMRRNQAKQFKYPPEIRDAVKTLKKLNEEIKKICLRKIESEI